MYGNLPFEISLKDNEIYPPEEEARKLAKESTEQYYKINKIRYDKKFQEADFKEKKWTNFSRVQAASNFFMWCPSSDIGVVEQMKR
ncbi:hypothetical protein TNCV_4464691 [Trichonephila clavipes]|nr:hypothetical protein TNCV_4464691 [Trichonephila clavipes]